MFSENVLHLINEAGKKNHTYIVVKPIDHRFVQNPKYSTYLFISALSVKNKPEMVNSIHMHMKMFHITTAMFTKTLEVCNSRQIFSSCSR